MSNSKDFPGGDGHGLWAFDRNGFYLGESGNNYGPFNFQTTCCGQEAEGLDYFDTGGTCIVNGSPQTPCNLPGIPNFTQLHALLRNKTLVSGETIRPKHYRS